MRARLAPRVLTVLFVIPFACSSGGSSNSASGSGGSRTTGSGGGTAGTGGSVTTGSGGGAGRGSGGVAGSSLSGTGGTVTGTGGAKPATGGAVGTGGVIGTGGAGGTASGQSVLERNNHPSRDGIFVQPKLTKAVAGTLKLESDFQATFTGNMWASPVYLQNGPGGKGLFFAVTTGNDVFALDETTGAKIWTHNIGSSPTANGVNCGGIHPLGIISTPVIDATTRTIYVAGAIGTTSISDHQVHALSVDDGTEPAGWPVSVKLTVGGTTFTPPPQNQRSALSLVASKLYVAYGGHVGDCGAYHGWVVAIDTTDPTKIGGWASGGQGEGIWAAGGMASDGNGVFALTGNNTAGTSTHLDSEQAVRITGMGTRSDAFYPTTWRTMDAEDADLGASSPVYFELPGSTPSNILAVVSKDGKLYLLDAGNLGGMGGQKVNFPVANGAMSIHTAVATYATSKGRYVVFGTNSGAMCASASGEAIVSVLIPSGSPPKPSIAWCAPLSGPVTGPISTTTDGISDVVIWYMNNGKLNGVDGDTGASLFTSSETCSNVRQWTSPIAVNGRIVVGGDGHLCAWSAP
jgi:hypothetical protein